MDRYPMMTLLVRSFPCLKGAPTPFDCMTLYRWVWRCGGEDKGRQQAVRFCLDVFNPGAADCCAEGDARKRKLPPFDLHNALSVWGPGDRNAFAVWVNRPWWP